MASPKETELSEQQSSNSNPTSSPTPARAESPSVDVAEDETQREHDVPDLAHVADSSTPENRHSEQAQRDPGQVGPDPAVTTTSARAVNPQQQAHTEAAMTVPGQRISDDEEYSYFNDEEGADSDQDRVWNPIDLEPTAPTCEAAGNDVSDHIEASNPTSRERSSSIVDNPEEYVFDGPIFIDGVLIEGSEESLGTPALTFPEHSVDNDPEPIPPTSTNFGHEHEEHDPSVAATPARSDRGDEGDRGSVTAASDDLGDRNGESSSPTAPASARSDHGDAESIELDMFMPVGSEQAGGENDGPVISRAASEEGSSGPSPENPIQDDSSSPVQKNQTNTTNEGENEEHTATPAQDVGESASQADAGTNHGREEVVSDPFEIPETPLRPTRPRSEDRNGPIILEREVQDSTSSSTQELEEELPSGDDPEVQYGRESPILHRSIIPETPSRPTPPLPGDSGNPDSGEGEVQEPASSPRQGLEGRRPSEDDMELNHSRESLVLQTSRMPESPSRPALRSQNGVEETVGVPADTALGASADDSTERQIGGSTEDARNRGGTAR